MSVRKAGWGRRGKKQSFNSKWKVAFAGSMEALGQASQSIDVGCCAPIRGCGGAQESQGLLFQVKPFSVPRGGGWKPLAANMQKHQPRKDLDEPYISSFSLVSFLDYSSYKYSKPLFSPTSDLIISLIILSPGPCLCFLRKYRNPIWSPTVASRPECPDFAYVSSFYLIHIHSLFKPW